MAEQDSFEARRFRSAAAFYLAGRPSYAPALIARVAELCGLRQADRMIDLGCGPAQLALAFAPLAGAVIAIDPEPEMLRIARANAAGTVNVSVLEGSSRDIAPQLGMVRLVTIGRAFHWMDRAQTLRDLDRIIEPAGAIAFFGDDHPQLPENAWHEAYRAIVDRYAEGDRMHGRWKSPQWVRHEGILLDSPFSRLEGVWVTERRRTPLDRIVDRAFSMSSTSHARLGDKAEAMGAELMAAMAEFASDGMVTEVVESHALIARRPADMTERRAAPP